jgi:TPR repeat protein
MLGSIFYHTDGVARDYAEAAKWFRLAAEQGLGKAQYNLGVMYLKGEGVAQDNAEAAKWLLLAAEQGFEPPVLLKS